MIFTKKTIGSWCIIATLFTACSKPIADFRISDEAVKTAPAKITFKNKSKKAESYQWDFGDGSSDTIQSPKHAYTLNGTYVVSLTTTYSCGQITVKDTVEVPPAPGMPETKVGVVLPAPGTPKTEVGTVVLPTLVGVFLPLPLPPAETTSVPKL